MRPREFLEAQARLMEYMLGQSRAAALGEDAGQQVAWVEKYAAVFRRLFEKDSVFRSAALEDDLHDAARLLQMPQEEDEEMN